MASPTVLDFLLFRLVDEPDSSVVPPASLSMSSSGAAPGCQCSTCSSVTSWPFHHLGIVPISLCSACVPGSTLGARERRCSTPGRVAPLMDGVNLPDIDNLFSDRLNAGVVGVPGLLAESVHEDGRLNEVVVGVQPLLAVSEQEDKPGDLLPIPLGPAPSKSGRYS